jgi:hypothetical protein
MSIITSKELAESFSPNKGDEVIIWPEENKHAGFSVLRSYKLGLGFIPVVTQSGKEDTKALIKIGIQIPDKLADKIPLFISATKYSKYRGSHFGIDFENPDAPKKESLNESESSKQPIDLEDRAKFVMQTDPISFFDVETNKKTSLNELIDYIYNLHLETISSGKGVALKAKLNFQKLICVRVIPKLISILKNILEVFGKEIKDDKEDFTVGLFKPYSFQKHIATKYPYSLPFFSSDMRISLINIFWISFSLLLLWYFYFVKMNLGEVFSIALSVILIAIFEFFVPIVLMALINSLIIFRNWFERKRFKFI